MKFIYGRNVICDLFPKFHVRHERFSFYGPRKSDEGADTDLIIFCRPKGPFMMSKDGIDKHVALIFLIKKRHMTVWLMLPAFGCCTTQFFTACG